MTHSITSSGLPPLILVVSDLHLLTGCDPASGRMNPRENFLADHAFARFLAAHQGTPSESEPLLVLNGDTFDFIRITDVPLTDEEFQEWEADLAKLGYRSRRPLQHTLVKKEFRYGLRTDDYKTVWKFRRIVQGHPAFFAALGNWVKSGGRLIFLKGNHDLEFHWPLLLHAIQEELATYAGDRARGSAVQVHEDWFQLHNVYLEHGHRFEKMTRVEGDPTIFRGEEVRFPYGSFFNKYLINQLEELDPFLDNVKPITKVIPVAIKRRPLSAFAILYYGVRALRGVIIRERAKHWLMLLLLLIIIALPIIVLATIILSIIFDPVWQTSKSIILGQHPIVKVLVIVLGLLPWLVGGVGELLRKKKFAHGEDEYGEGIYEALEGRAGSFEQMYGIIGHTHRMDVQHLGTYGGSRCIYLNSGSWTPRWDEHRPDLNGRIEYSFIRLDLEGDEYRHRLLQWRDDRTEEAPALIYAPLKRDRPRWEARNRVKRGPAGTS
jgi:UDP-2,3-diacylglucosamine pyrophosphatase LpxH